MSDIRPIRTHADYEKALLEVEAFFNDQPKVGTPDGDRFAVLITLIKAYEDEHYLIPDADPIEVLEFFMSERGLTQSDLAEAIGAGRGRASEIINRIRPLTLDMIRAINDKWKIPVEALTDEYELAKEYA